MILSWYGEESILKYIFHRQDVSFNSEVLRRAGDPRRLLRNVLLPALVLPKTIICIMGSKYLHSSFLYVNLFDENSLCSPEPVNLGVVPRWS